MAQEFKLELDKRAELGNQAAKQMRDEGTGTHGTGLC